MVHSAGRAWQSPAGKAGRGWISRLVYRFFRFFSGDGRSAVVLAFFFEVSADGPNDGFVGFAFGSLRCLKARLMRPMQSRVAPETHARNATREHCKECPRLQRTRPGGPTPDGDEARS